MIYAILSEQLIGDMFLAALLPGLLAAAGFAVAIRVSVWLGPSIAPLEARADRRDRRRALASVWVVVGVFLVVIGGIYIGWFMPVEGASVGGCRDVLPGSGTRHAVEGPHDGPAGHGADFGDDLSHSPGRRDLFSAGLAFTRLPQELGAWLTEAGAGPWLVVFLMLLFYLAAGCFMDSLSVILLTMPVFLPILLALDLGMTADDTAIWFGVLALVVIELGLITPPVSMNVYVIHGLARNVALSDTFRGLIPFIAIELVCIDLLFAMPDLVLWLPRLGS